MINVGVIVDGKPILSYEQFLEMLRREVLGVGCSFSTNTTTGRCELVMRGVGTNRRKLTGPLSG